MKKFSMLLALLMFSNQMFASDANLNSKWIAEIVQDQPQVIRSIQNERAYFDSKHLFFENDQIFLDAGDRIIPLPSIYADPIGCYIPVDQGIFVICGNCAYKFEINEIITSCPNCGYGGE